MHNEDSALSQCFIWQRMCSISVEKIDNYTDNFLELLEKWKLDNNQR